MHYGTVLCCEIEECSDRLEHINWIKQKRANEIGHPGTINRNQTAEEEPKNDKAHFPQSEVSLHQTTETNTERGRGPTQTKQHIQGDDLWS
jgi:hypothetical protein